MNLDSRTTMNNPITNVTTEKEDITMSNNTNSNVTTMKEVRTMNNPITNVTTESTTCQPVSKKMFLLTHFNFITKAVELQPHQSNDAFRFALKKGFDPEKEFVFVDCEIRFDDEETRPEWRNAVVNGIDLNGSHYMPLCTTPSGVKAAQSIWCVDEHLVMYSRKFRNGFHINGVAMEPCKFFTRMGLYFSTSTPVDEAYPNFIVNFDKVHVIKDIARNGKVVSDGAIFIYSDRGNLPDEAASLRPLMKGAAIPCNHMPDVELDDLWGNKFRLRDAQVLAFESTFKFASLCKSRERFVAALKESDISVAVRMNKHGLKNLTYQPLQTLRFNEKQIEQLEEYGKNYLESFKELKNFVRLLPTELREAVLINPSLANDPYVKEMAQTGYRKIKMALRGGAIPNAGKFFCICPDKVDLFGGNGLKAGECCIHSLPEGYLIMIRYPHTAEASWVVLYNRHINNGIADPNVLSINNYDDSLRNLGGADYDGDKVFVITNEEIDALITEVLKDMGPQKMPPAMEGKATKYVFSKDNAQGIKTAYFTGITTKSQIGSVSNKLSAAYAALHEAYANGDDEAIAKARELVTYYQIMVELTVDKEKHGYIKLEAPESNKTFDKTLPEHIMFAKLAKRIGTPEKLVVNKDNYRNRPDLPLEQYSMFINDNTVMAKEFCLDDVGGFLYEDLMFKGDLVHFNRKVFNHGEPLRDANGQVVHDEKGAIAQYVNHGSFDRLVFAKSEDLVELGKKYSLNCASMTELRCELIRILMEKYAAMYNCDIKDVYNLIVFHVYTIEGKASVAYKRVFWQALHTFAEEALLERFGEAAVTCDLDELGDIDDVAEYDDDDEIDY